MWSDTTKYVNVNKPLVKDEYKSCKKLFDEIDFNSFWFSKTRMFNMVV